MANEAATETQITPQRATELAGSGAELIDVRHTDEWDAGRIAGARHLEMNDLADHAESIPRDRPVIFYCRVGNRSAMATEAFRASGFTAYNLAGGITEWVRQGRPIEPADGHVAQH